MSSQEKSENSAFMMRGQRDMQKYANRGDDFNREKKGMQYNRSHAENQRKQKGCWECGKFGHIRKNCWLLPGNERPNSSSSEKRRSNRNNNMAPEKTRQRDAIVGEMLITPMEREDRSTSWILDSGASEHICDKREWYVTYKTLKNHPIRIGDGRILHAVAKGDINESAFNGNKWKEKFFANVLHVPGLKYNLFSMGTALKKNMTFESNNTQCSFYRNDEVIVTGYKNPDETIFTMKIKVEPVEKLLFTEENVTSNEIKNNLQLWHERLAHQNFTHVKCCLKYNGIDVKDDSAHNFCNACALGKMHRSPFPNSENRTTRVGEIIHSDLCGPMEENSIGGSRYFLQFKDDFSSYVTLYFLKNKRLKIVL